VAKLLIRWFVQPPLEKSSAAATLEILHADPWIVVVAKPSGLLVHRTDQARDTTAVLQLARDATGGAHLFPVHRLDRGASGVLVLARSSEAARVLQAQFEDGSADKRYLALVRGAPPQRGVIDHPIPRKEGGPRVPAVTEYRRIETVTVPFRDRAGAERAQSYSLVEARPRTGRLHQVRRHLKHAGHPLVGDVNHGRVEHNRWCREHYGLERLALHAASLAFDHPGTAERVRFEAPLPEDLRGPLRRMGFGV
jgi:tRNA pseudouridine65 synthase